ncbi:response regulator [Desulfospira joergensenii]|uniref:response regulator n=1 Tax=Desulfospira joergensenii TaxID=53329 RepID=UPI0003B4EAFE|nr:response regulator [Desulfospira joergensenii]
MTEPEHKNPSLTRFRRFQKSIMERMLWPHSLEQNSLIRWRAFILSSVLIAGLFLGFFALVAAGVMIVKENAWGLAAVDLSGLMICLAFLFVRGISFEIRSTVTLLTFYLIGISVVLTVGPLSGGPAWLFAFAVLAGVLMGNRAALVAILMNALFLSVTGFFVSTGKLGAGFPFFKSSQIMIAAGVNFIVLNAIAAVSVSALVKGLFLLIEEQENLTRDLLRERRQMMEIQKKLESEVRERKQAEKELYQARKMESIGTLAGGIAHDFNNLLYMILGNTELALTDLGNPGRVEKNLNQVKEAGLRAADIVKQLLNFSSKNDQAFKPVHAVKLLRGSLKFLRSTIPSNIEIKAVLPEKETVILADEVQINQVMMNLCINSAQAMEETGGRLEVKALVTRIERSLPGFESSPPPGPYFKITVSDTGPGIREEFLEKIFDPYFTTKELGKGSGMGLAVVHGIIKNHKGLIRVESRMNQGTLFKILLPMTDLLPEPEPVPETGVHRGKEKILFIDDEQMILNMARKTLEHLGYDVETRINPLEALEEFRSRPEEFDLVISDMTMPRMTGDQLAAALLEIRKDLPIIICSGHSNRMDKHRAEELGIARYLLKPVSMSDYSKAIREVLGAEPDQNPL